MQCGSMSSQCQLILLGCRKMLQMPSAPFRCWDAVATPCCCAAIAVLWLALAPEKFPLQTDTFGSAAGTAGKQKWSLILPSSARVSELTYVTIVGARYPELDTFQNDIIQFGNYLQGEQSTRGGFLPIFWDAQYSSCQY